MNLTLYTLNDETNRINKNPVLGSSLVGTLKENCSILNPSIVVQADMIIENYAFIEEFDRYYFIDNITSVRNGLWQLDMRVDVLYTYRSQILELNAVIRRQENNWNVYLDDPEFKVYNNKLIQTKKFPNGFNKNPEFILTISGG